MDDDSENNAGTVIDAIIYTMAFPRGGGAMMAEVQIMLEPNQWERDDATIRITTGVSWEKDTDTVDLVRRRAVLSAHRLLKAAAALSEDELLRLVDHCLFEEDLPALHRRGQRH